MVCPPKLLRASAHPCHLLLGHVPVEGPSAAVHGCLPIALRSTYLVHLVGSEDLPFCSIAEFRSVLRIA